LSQTLPDSDKLVGTLRRNDDSHTVVVARSNQGMVRRLHHAGRTLAVKSAVGDGLVGAVNRLALRREFRAYRRLQGVRGVPHCHGLVDGRWLVLDFVEAAPFRDAAAAPEFFAALLGTLRAMHERGVAHGDLKRKANLMVDCSGGPILIDFGAAVIRREGRHPLNRRLFEFMRQTDLNAWVKLKYGGYENVADDDDRALLKRSWIERGLGRIRR
jgi:RIO-like serine/threonine protein kinase